MKRCGADAERLSAIGIGIGEFMERHPTATMSAVVEGFALDWQGLVAFGWTPALLSDKVRCPVPVLVKEPVALTAEKLLDSFEVSYQTLNALALSVEELYAFRFNAPLLAQLGMKREDVLADVTSEEVMDHGGTAWYCETMGLTKTLYKGIPYRDAVVSRKNPLLQRGIAALELYFSRHGEFSQ